MNIEEGNGQLSLPIFFRMIEEALEEQTEPIQKAYAKDWAKKRLSTIGKKIKSAPFDQDPPKERSKSAPPGFGAVGEEVVKEEDIEEISSMAGGSVQGYSLPLGAKPKKKKKNKDLDETSQMQLGDLDSTANELSVQAKKKQKPKKKTNPYKGI